ncbi:MAG TPA: CBS domain-containing protein [Marinagarivorans sp.]
MYVANIMTRAVHTVAPDDCLSTLNDIFVRVSYRHLLVKDDNRLVGVISDRDALKHLSPFLGQHLERKEDRDQLSLKVSDIMSTQLITVDADTLIDSASILLLENNISCLPVIKGDMQIDGILSWKDILQYHVYGDDKSKGLAG